MKYFIGLILSLISGIAMAEAIPFPACPYNNQPVSYWSVGSNFDNTYARYGIEHIAESNLVKGKPIIAYNSALMSGKPKEWNLHVMLHECAHIKLHINQYQHPIIKEYEADCHGATILKDEYGYGDEEFDIIINTMSKSVPPDRVQAFKSCIGR